MMKILVSCWLVVTALSVQAGEWKLVWSDEFDKPGLPDAQKWDYETGFIRNNEEQYYTRGRSENARVEDGHLVIEARKESFKNPEFDASKQNNRGRSAEFAKYTSASLTTRGKASWTYGRVEVRAQLPGGRGTWPAIWMLGTNMSEVGWPRCGEIDIMEFVGYEPGVVHANIHTGKYNHTRNTGKGDKLAVADASSAFHIYAMEWNADTMDFFVDDHKYFTFRNEKTGDDVWPYDRPEFLILNLAIGGAWGGQKGIDEASFPQRYLIDYVHVYQAADDRKSEERLSFQTAGPWSPRINLDADVAMVYGIGRELPAKIATWKRRGYTIHVMTGVAWGGYQEYLNGNFDGEKHWDQAQMDRHGNMILHGPEVPYISPGENYGKYLCGGVKRALDAGAEAIHLEEPEFWTRGGWEENFKREWKAYYQEDWQAPDSSPDAQYRSSKLKYFLYRRALAQIFDFAKEYGKTHNRTIRCYVPTHSLLNYAHWHIVSPESSLLNVGCDGYIAQVWTGTARTPNMYENRHQERTFETAFLEYGAMQNLVRASGRRVWYLNDPVEDNGNHDWDDYRTNWESTLTASLLQPEVCHYEIMPWPDRIFNGRYKPGKRDAAAPSGRDRVPISDAYETELQAVIRALGEMKQPADQVKWIEAGTQGIGVLVSDTMMFQRADPKPSDENLGSFYGLAMPLLKRGMPVQSVQIESAAAPGFLSRYQLLLLTYEGQKPPTPEFHEALSKWVRAGGALVVVDDDRDPYNAVREWWNTSPQAYATPREHLFEKLGLAKDAAGLHKVDRGLVLRSATSPAAMTYRPDGAETLRKLVRQAAEESRLAWKESNALVLQRGPYIIAAGLDESVPDARPFVLKGRFLDLFDADLPLLSSLQLLPGKRSLLFDLSKADTNTPAIVAASCQIKDEQTDAKSLHFKAEGIAETDAVIRVLAKAAPSEVRISGKVVPTSDYAFTDGILRLRFANSVDGVLVVIRF